MGMDGQLIFRFKWFLPLLAEPRQTDTMNEGNEAVDHAVRPDPLRRVLFSMNSEEVSLFLQGW